MKEYLTLVGVMENPVKFQFEPEFKKWFRFRLNRNQNFEKAFRFRLYRNRILLPFRYPARKSGSGHTLGLEQPTYQISAIYIA